MSHHYQEGTTPEPRPPKDKRKKLGERASGTMGGDDRRETTERRHERSPGQRHVDRFKERVAATESRFRSTDRRETVEERKRRLVTGKDTVNSGARYDKPELTRLHVQSLEDVPGEGYLIIILTKGSHSETHYGETSSVEDLGRHIYYFAPDEKSEWMNRTLELYQDNQKRTDVIAVEIGNPLRSRVTIELTT